jgi:hypothetical protein
MASYEKGGGLEWKGFDFMERHVQASTLQCATEHSAVQPHN